jgi:predicted nucleotidyltransferase
MEIQIKKAIKAGNSSAVVLPKAWLNKEVRVELMRKSEKDILLDSFEILCGIMPSGEIVGVYLAGSYARKEEDENSDIDLLVITKNIDKEVIHEGIYNVLIISEKLLSHKLEHDLFPVGQMIKEAKPLLNADYIKNLKIKATKKNTKWYLDTTEEKINLTEKILENLKEKNKDLVDNRVIYTLVLRIRTLEIITKLLKNVSYSKKEFIKLVKRISGSDQVYEGYLSVKNDCNNSPKSTLKEAQIHLGYLKKQLNKVKSEIGE